MDESEGALSKIMRERGLSFEAGVGLGYGQTKDPSETPPVNLNREVSDKSGVLQAYILARNPWLGVELGYLNLPKYHARAWTDDYPAYKGIPAGSYPQTADVSQDIEAGALYKRLNAYLPEILGVEPYGFYGKAKVTSKNHEHALYNNKDHADYKETLTKEAPYFGGGLNYPLSKNVNLRAEIGKIRNGTSSYHTGNRDLLFGLLGLGAKF